MSGHILNSPQTVLKLGKCNLRWNTNPKRNWIILNILLCHCTWLLVIIRCGRIYEVYKTVYKTCGQTCMKAVCRSGPFRGVCVCVWTRMKDISNDVKESTFAAHQSGKGYVAVWHSFSYSENIHKWKIISAKKQNKTVEWTY